MVKIYQVGLNAFKNISADSNQNLEIPKPLNTHEHSENDLKSTGSEEALDRGKRLLVLIL